MGVFKITVYYIVPFRSYWIIDCINIMTFQNDCLVSCLIFCHFVYSLMKETVLSLKRQLYLG